MGTLSLEGGWIITGNEDEPWIDNGHVLVRDGIIVSVGAGSTPTEADEVIDASGMMVSPGFVNAHTHTCMSLGRTLGIDASLLDWLSGSQLPLMSTFDPEDYELAVQLGALENLKAGNTTVCEVFFSNRLEDGADALAANALDATGLRSILFRSSNDLPFAPGFAEDLEDIERRSNELINRWSGSSRTGIGVGPLVPWAATRDYWEQTKVFVESGVRAHLHTAETPEYNDLVRAQTGLSNVQLLAEVGVLGPATILNHCIHLSDGDIDLISKYGSPVIHDPTSNMMLASGVAPVPALRQAGITVGLACDGPACNNTQDMFEVMKNASLLNKVTTRDPSGLTARDVFIMATAGGADASGLGGITGRIASGYAADLVLVDTRAPHLTPLHDPLAALVYSARASDVHTVIVDGNVVMRNRSIPVFDEQEFLARAQERAFKLASSL
ncbi:MAG: amidohydrolase family protein [Actinomycetota bacterium]